MSDNQVKKEAVCALIYGPTGGIIAVSRRDNHNQWGLIGGSVEEGETILQALIRETLEETGLRIITYQKIFVRRDENFVCYTYLCTAEGEITTDYEVGGVKGIVKEVTWNDLFAGPFGEYNRDLYRCIPEYIFVNYTIAFSLKKLGFNRSCFGYYTGKERLCRYINTTSLDFEVCNYHNLHREYVLAPTKQQVIDWFFDVHLIKIDFLYNLTEGKFAPLLIDYKGQNFHELLENMCNSRDIAIDLAINEAIKIIS